MSIESSITITAKGILDTGIASLDYRVCGGTIRQDIAGSGWHFIDDGVPGVSGHHPYGFGNVEPQADGKLKIYFAEQSVSMGSFMCGMDESFSASGLSAGASVASTYILLSLFAPFECRISGSTVVFGAYLSGSCTVDLSEVALGKITINHPTFTHPDSGPALNICQYDKVAGANEYIGLASSKVKTVIGSFGEIGGTITCTAGNITVAHGLVVAPTVTWDAVANHFVITHAIAQSVHDYGATACDFVTRPVVEIAGSTTLRVAVADASRTKYLGAVPPDCKFNFRRAGRAACSWPNTTRIQVNRGRLRVPCQDVGGSSSNIWLTATFAVADVPDA